ncbi:hypothetical protein F5Y18DRAFT_23212 [Xylariaceae sp. FL1019]|nr:hypothetical protein F5Y18DRAFT_23212 [Xylariaceae sp. FL1019]
MACVLFNICLSIFLEQDSSIGRVVALDEAHRYMGESSECETLTNSLLAAIRLQRHLGVRTIISTQEPTISPKLLDLCSITIVHQFSSPDWLSALTKHLAGISTASKAVSRMRDEDSTSSEKATTSLIGPQGVTLAAEDPVTDLFSKIVGLPQGHAFVFAPRAVVALEKRVLSGGKCSLTPQRLAHNILRVVIRNRITSDGGQSIMAS